MGSDAYGRDQFSRFLYGGQISMLAGLIAAILSVSHRDYCGRDRRILRRMDR